MTNEVAGNQIAAYTRATNGNITRRRMYATGGSGTGAGLGSQGALIFQEATNLFFAVNAGDNTISMLALDAAGDLSVVSTVPSGGVKPISITVSGSTVYVANEGDRASEAANISGFSVTAAGLVAIPGSTQPLSVSDPRPGQIAFTPDGARLVVTEKATRTIDVYDVSNGVAGAGSFQPSSGITPFALAFSPEGLLIVAEVGAGGGPTSAVSSYAIGSDRTLTTITGSLATNQTAACWLVTAGGTAYVANAASATITGVNVDTSGALTLHEASGVTATTGTGAIDLALTADNGFLYSLAGGAHSISVFQVFADGSLSAMPALTGVPSHAAGLVAR